MASDKSASGWVPSKKPDPSAILQEAVADRIAGRYRVALAKHLWFHRFALKFEPSLAGVRLSFALRYWKELGDRYSPALRELRRIRNDCLEKVRLGERFQFDVFHDLRSINRYLGRDNLTVRVFEELDQHRPRVAQRAYSLVEDILLRRKRFALCSKYIENPLQIVRDRLESYGRDQKALKKGIYNEETFKTVTRLFRHSIAKLIAILAIIKRDDEALAVAKLIFARCEDVTLHSMIRCSLEGKIPER